MAKKEPFEDDGRTVADMSGVENPSTSLLGRFPKRRRTEKDGETPSAPLTKKQNRMVIAGALLAALLIGGVFIIGGAIAIAIMLAFWT
ncbi:MAG: hypothetical protein IKX66_04190 [Clostridia bacterium]|nr:hypothetical protein [Clostridia bacterium]